MRAAKRRKVADAGDGEDDRCDDADQRIASLDARGKDGDARTLCLSQPIGWRLTEYRAMPICNERSCQAHCVGGCRSVSVAGSD